MTDANTISQISEKNEFKRDEKHDCCHNTCMKDANSANGAVVKQQSHQIMSIAEIKDVYSFDLQAYSSKVEKEDLPSDYQIIVQNGDEFDLHLVGINKHVPKTKEFMIA